MLSGRSIKTSTCQRHLCVCLWWSTGDGGGSGVITDAEIKSISEALYVLDSNKASASELIIDPQALVDNSQTSSQSDLSPRPWGDYFYYHTSHLMFPLFSCVNWYLWCVFVLCFQLVPIRGWRGSVLQTYLRCFPGCAGQLPKDDWTDRGLQPSAAGRAGDLCQGDHVQHWAGERAVCFPLHKG